MERFYRTVSAPSDAGASGQARGTGAQHRLRVRAVLGRTPGRVASRLNSASEPQNARTLGLDYLGQTGKFHTSWGDFHSFKNLPALRFEYLRMLAHGAKCLIGDQLAPSGRIDPTVYDLVGEVYGEIARKEPWCASARPVTEIGVLTNLRKSWNNTSQTAALSLALLPGWIKRRPDSPRIYLEQPSSILGRLT